MSEAIDDMVAYTKLTDDITLQIMRSDDPNLEESRRILELVQKRQLYKCIGQTQPPDGTVLDRVTTEMSLFVWYWMPCIFDQVRALVNIFVRQGCNHSYPKPLFINTADSFAIPIGGECITWVCINLCLWPVKIVETWEVAPVLMLIKDSFFIPIGREHRPGQLCHITRRAHHSLIRSCLPEGGGGPYHFITGGVLCWKKSVNNYNFCIYFTFWPNESVFQLVVETCRGLVLDNLPRLRLSKIIKNQASLGLNH